MATSPKRTVIPYNPGNPPTVNTLTDAIRATWDELEKISQALFALDRAVALTVHADDVLSVGPTITYTRLLDNSPVVEYQQPPGMFDPATGIFTAPAEGLYSIHFWMNVPAFPTPAAKTYTANVRVTFVRAGYGTQITAFTDSGTDDQPLNVTATFLAPMTTGDTITIDGDLTHATKTGNVTVSDGLQVFRVSAIK